MAPSLLHLPNGQVVTVKPIFGGLRFEPQDLNVHRSPFPPGWIIILNTEDEADRPEAEDAVIPDGDGAASRLSPSHAYRRPTLNNDTVFISSISNPSSSDFKLSVSQSRQIAMMLWTSLCWYFHQPQPEPQVIGTGTGVPVEGRPHGEWRIRIKREGIFKGRHLLSKLERMGLVWSTDASVGTDLDDRSGDGFTHLYVSQRSFWQIDARLFLFTLSPAPHSPFTVLSPHNSRPGSPSRVETPREGLVPQPGSLTTRTSVGPPANADTQSYGLWAPSTPGPFQSASHLPTYYPPPPAHFVMTNNVRHPLRPKAPRPGEVFYTRYIPSLQEYISFRACSASDRPVTYRGPLGNVAHGRTSSSTSYSELALIPNDIDILHSWMNNPRVNKAWGEEGPREHQEKFLIANLKSQHSFPIFGCWDGKPFGYFEIYWVKEDRLGRYVNRVGNWDRGIHLLVGEEEFRGRHRFNVWLSALIHWLWLIDSRTETIYLEPRVDNTKLITYLQELGFYKEREVSLPHKQSALMKLSREAWEAPFL